MLPDASSFSAIVDDAFYFILFISVIFFVGIVATMIFFVVRYHHTRNKTVENIEGNLTLEIVWTVIPTILVMFMFYYGFIGYRDMRTPPEDAMKIKVTARKWSWTFTYENGYQAAELKVPKGRAVKAEIESEDVIHSFYIPAFRVKQDAVPGRDTFLWFNATETGTFDILCTEYCGDRHSYMLSTVEVLPGKQFDNWYAGTSGQQVTEGADLSALGEKLVTLKGCTACHSLDGTPRISRSFKGLFGMTETVLTQGKERQIVVDEEYLIRSIKEPDADKVKEFASIPMPPQNLTDDEIKAIVEYLKQSK
ncbi:cytochrome c oxidase subunit II [candidate division KSB1 bacterium]|nr:cytochrome c oxidase subunit II [candidate division KSB1 bacterium]